MAPWLHLRTPVRLFIPLLLPLHVLCMLQVKLAKVAGYEVFGGGDKGGTRAYEYEGYEGYVFGVKLRAVGPSVHPSCE